jgi:beta-1,2-mannosidase
MNKILAAAIAAGFVVVGPAQAQHSWMAGPFTKIDSVNPCLVPLASSVFNCPVRNAEVGWESKDVFNPAAVVHEGKVYLLYRAQDRIGKPEGTSRIGLAWSDDGLRFTRSPAPVLYPDNDFMKQYEWEGG